MLTNRTEPIPQLHRTHTSTAPRAYLDCTTSVPQPYPECTTSVPRPHHEVSSTCVVVKTNVVRGTALAPAQIYSIVVYQDNDNLLSRSEPGEPNPAKPRLRDANNKTYSTCTRFEARREYQARMNLECTVPQLTGSVPREYLTAP